MTTWTRRGGRCSKNIYFYPRSGLKISTQRQVLVKKGQNCVHIVSECPLIQNISEFSHLGQPNCLLQPQVGFTAHKAPLLSFGSEWYKRQRRVKSFVYPPSEIGSLRATWQICTVCTHICLVPNSSAYPFPNYIPHPVNRD